MVAVSILWFIIRADSGSAPSTGTGAASRSPAAPEPAGFCLRAFGQNPGTAPCRSCPGRPARQDPGKRMLAYKSRRSYGIKSTNPVIYFSVRSERRQNSCCHKARQELPSAPPPCSVSRNFNNTLGTRPAMTGTPNTTRSSGVNR